MATWTSSRKSSLCQSIVCLQLGLPKAIFCGLTLASMEPQTLCRSASAKHQPKDGLKERPGPPKWVPLLILLLFFLVLEEIHTLWLWVLV